METKVKPTLNDRFPTDIIAQFIAISRVRGYTSHIAMTLKCKIIVIRRLHQQINVKEMMQSDNNYRHGVLVNRKGQKDSHSIHKITAQML